MLTNNDRKDNKLEGVACRCCLSIGHMISHIYIYFYTYTYIHIDLTSSFHTCLYS